jgi:hypothetical protein
MTPLSSKIEGRALPLSTPNMLEYDLAIWALPAAI